MNIILFDKNELDSNKQLKLIDDRNKHIHSILKVTKGDLLNVGEINGKIGKGYVVYTSQSETLLDITLDEKPPAPLHLKLALAMPRPKVLKRIIYNATTLGVKEFHIFNSWRVEKSFWKSPIIEPEALDNQIRLGLEQAKDTLIPEIKFYRYFNNFAKNNLEEISKDTNKLLAHPYLDDKQISLDSFTETTLIIGPEGGFIEREIEFFEDQGFQRIQVGNRILKVETAVTALISKLYF